MELQELYGLLELPKEIIEKLDVAQRQVDFVQLEPLLDGLMHIETAPKAYEALCGALGEDEGNIKMLLCQLECARRDEARYAQRGIACTVFVDTMKCFTRFIRECGEKNDGRLFFDRGWWSYRQIAMTLFRVGALEYEFRAHEGENAITIHIPSDADFSAAAIDASLDAAEKMFAKSYPEYPIQHIICNSWLLSPTLQTLLPETSHIVAFQKRFEIVKEDNTQNACINWVFNTDDVTDYASLPEKTTLQRRAKAHLLAGGVIGSAYGVMKPRKQ